MGFQRAPELPESTKKYQARPTACLALGWPLGLHLLANSKAESVQHGSGLLQVHWQDRTGTGEAMTDQGTPPKFKSQADDTSFPRDGFIRPEHSPRPGRRGGKVRP